MSEKTIKLKEIKINLSEEEINQKIKEEVEEMVLSDIEDLEKQINLLIDK